MTNPERQINQPVTRRRLLALGAGATGTLGSFLAAMYLRQAPLINEPAGASAQEPATPTIIPTETVASTNTPKPVDTATTVAPTIALTFTPEPTKPPLTPTPEATLTPTETPKPPEKSPLPEYGAFMGNLRNIKTGENGMIMISPIPKKPKGQQIVIYFQEGDRTGTTFGAYPLDLVSIRDNSFKAETLTSGPSWGKGLYVIEAEWNPKTQTIEGRFIRNAKGQLQEEIRTFEVNFLGIGRLKVLEAVKKTKTAVRGGDWTRVNIEEFERDITLP